MQYTSQKSDIAQSLVLVFRKRQENARKPFRREFGSIFPILGK